jgi:hypothetical protein
MQQTWPALRYWPGIFMKGTGKKHEAKQLGDCVICLSHLTTEVAINSLSAHLKLWRLLGRCLATG